MKLHEYQAKELLARYGVLTPRGRMVEAPRDARRLAEELGAERFAVKAQIPAGGRGQSGGVALVTSPQAAATATQQLLGRRLVTNQTGSAGYAVDKVLVEEALEPSATLYLSLLIDTATASIVILAGPEGSGDIEERVRSGEAHVERLETGAGGEVPRKDIEALAERLGLSRDLQSAFTTLVGQLRTALIELDATLIEINPLAVTTTGELVALDAKMILDDNALFRHPDLNALRDDEDDDKIEMGAQDHQLNYVRLDGDIGIAVNGAGLGLATLDMVHAANGRPANFMDIRTTATSLDVAHGFAMLLENPSVRSILVNVHGGGMQPCDIIADGLGIAMRRTGRSCPTIVRLAGNNAEYARFRFKNFGCKVIDCPDMWTAVSRAVDAAQSAGARQ
ncbi:ADP-forming succinate--CoA ligase subunit beta [Mesorhizobium xinjiangense]|uniref:ADP-forming succinate--CoA ligase subunit beta n=1 Tax=Mesorhizobium xinjiangense TaxID=2678685 RepID=UPI0012ED97B8|nr:ADP-forming succinate--CoA ligase subunit beta [Mesorhizobium xinjiangense]